MSRPLQNCAPQTRARVSAPTFNPNLAAAWYVSGWLMVYLGEPDEAIERFATAMRLSPRDPLLFRMHSGIAYAHFFASH
jgi:hypothetical protein